jgi:hypothetical protein
MPPRLLFVAAALALSCSGSKTCPDHAVRLVLSCPTLPSVDRISIDVSDGSISKQLPDLERGCADSPATYDIEVSDYRPGRTLHVVLTPRRGSSPAAAVKSEDIPLSGTCERREITIGPPTDGGAAAPDASAGGAAEIPDGSAGLGGTPPRSDGSAGMMTGGVSGQGGAAGAPVGGSCVPSAEDCFNGKDDDCDEKPDCADPDCSPTAVCVPTNNAFAYGTIASGAAGCSAPFDANITTLGSDLIGDATCTGCGCQAGTTTCVPKLFVYQGSQAECANDSALTRGDLVTKAIDTCSAACRTLACDWTR